MLAIVVAASAFAASCATRSPDGAVPTRFTAVPKSSAYTNWALNWCRDGEPVKNLFESAEFDCVQVGGEIYKVRVTDLVSLDGTRLPGSSYVLVARHALGVRRSNTTRWYFSVVDAEPAMAADTGVTLFARHYRSGIVLCDETQKSEGCWTMEELMSLSANDTR